MNHLKGKVGLIIGIANDKSIAYGCAQQIKSQGAEIAITYANEKSEKYVRPLAEQLEASIVMPCDVQDESQMDALFEVIRKQWGRLDFLIHSIAFASKKDLQNRTVNCSREGFLEALDVSCYSFIHLSRLAEPLMVKGGSILTMSFYGSQKVIKNYNVMGIAKAALECSVRYLACELGTHHIRVNAISPGPIQTRAASGLLDFEACIEAAKERSPLDYKIDPSKVGNLAAFLVSDASDGITGQVCFVDSGYSIMG